MNKQTAVQWFASKVMYLKMNPKEVFDFLQWYEEALEMEKEQIIEERKIYKRISDLPQFMNPIETDKIMNIYLGQQAKSLFYMREVPVESIGVFESIGGDWLYWFSDGFTYDTGVADTEAEALQIAKKNFRPYKTYP
jgi:hypothetical protein